MAITVNGEPITDISIEQERQRLQQESGVTSNQAGIDRVRLMLWDSAKQNVIDHLLCKQEATKRGLTVDEEQVELQISNIAERNGGLSVLENYIKSQGQTIEDLKQDMRDRMFVDALVDAVYNEIKEPKERHAKRYYKEHREQYQTPEQVKLRVIEKRFSNPSLRSKAQQEITKIYEALTGGKSFKLMINQKSDRPQNGGSLGWAQRGNLDAKVEERVFVMEAGQFTEPLEAQNSWQILEVEEKQEASEKSFDEVKAEIIQILWQEERQSKLKQLVDKLRKAAVIKED